jgi:hypothetical protein
MSVAVNNMPVASLRLGTVKVAFSQLELAALDAHRGHYSRAEYLRAAGLDARLQAAPGASQARTWAGSAPVQSSFEKVNGHALEINTIALQDGPGAAASELLARSGQVLGDFAAFRLNVFGDGAEAVVSAAVVGAELDSKPAASLRLATVKVGFTQAELAALDDHRGHYSRAEFLRSAALGARLKAAPGAELATSWAETARIQSSLHHIDRHAQHLNTLTLNNSQGAAARELLANSSQILADFTEFRIAVFGGSGEA